MAREKFLVGFYANYIVPVEMVVYAEPGETPEKVARESPDFEKTILQARAAYMSWEDRADSIDHTHSHPEGAAIIGADTPVVRRKDEMKVEFVATEAYGEVARLYFSSEALALQAVAKVIAASQWFELMPLPDDVWRITLKVERSGGKSRPSVALEDLAMDIEP